MHERADNSQSEMASEEKAAMSLIDFTLGYGGQPAVVEDLSVNLRRGVMTIMLGPNAALTSAAARVAIDFAGSWRTGWREVRSA